MITQTSLSSPATLLTHQHAAEIERLHAISVEIASLQEMQKVMDRALDYCLDFSLRDARLPDMDGNEVCRRLLAATPDLAVIILTTFAEDDLVRRCVQAGRVGVGEGRAAPGMAFWEVQ